MDEAHTDNPDDTGEPPMLYGSHDGDDDKDEEVDDGDEEQPGKQHIMPITGSELCIPSSLRLT